jgi:hypothetical protein
MMGGTKINELFSKLEGWHKRLLLIIAIITATQFLTPYVIDVYNFFANSYKVQRDYNGISERLTNLEDYTEVLNGIVDGVGDTRYHRGVRYLITKGAKDRTAEYKTWENEEKLRWDLAHCDWYYKSTDTDGIIKWFGAKYNSQKDIFSYIDHNGEHHEIVTLKESKLLKSY